MIFGVACPGCGLGRATLALITGHPSEALRWHPLVFVVLPALFVFLRTPVVASQSLGAGELRSLFSFRTLSAIALLVAVLGVWIARFGGAFGGQLPVRSPLHAAR